ncbi:MAG: ABC transporter ATP-binding protein [Eubacteriaceae bacterium]|jgi:iron complex transport system ATP-binding protein|nr:ABC transporter ATP-binding protein [Eubacteriaceae bacterium]
MNFLEVRDLTFKYDRCILNHISFDVERGSFISLLGINGAGKTTLIKNLNKLLKPTCGSVFIDGLNIADLKSKALAQKMAYVDQHCEPAKNTVFDTILVGRVPHINADVVEEDYQKTEEIINKLNLQDYALREADTLSGGEFQKVVMARALAQEPKLLLLDEPTSNLDIKNQVEVMKLIKEYCEEKNISVIVSIHDINLALQFSDKFLMMKNGEIYRYGDESIITAKSIKDVYKIDVDVIRHKNRKSIILN